MFQDLPPDPPAVVETLPATAPVAVAPPEESVDTAREVRVAAALTDTQIKVDTGFSGASIVLYGAVFNPTDTPTDVVLVVRGPDQTVRLVKKTRHNGVWLNSRPVVFEGAPGFYMTSSTRALQDVADFGQLRRLGVGVDHLRINAPEEATTVTRYGIRDVVISRLGEDYLDWRRAVIRLKESAGLYKNNPSGVRFVDRGLFRAEVDLPATAPTGVYYAEVWLFQEGSPISVSNMTLTVEKVGLERRIYQFAHHRPWLYGIMCVLIAMAVGYGASRVFRNR